MADDIVTIEGTYLFQDYLAAHRLNRHAPKIALRLASILIGAVLVFFGIGIFDQASLVNIIAGVFFLLWGVFLSEQVFRLQVKRRWKQYPALREKAYTLSLSNDGISSLDDVGNPNMSKWDKLAKWKEGNDIFLLYFSSHLWLSIPKRLLQPKDVETVRKLLGSHVPSQSHGLVENAR